jgi:hypothetical protein
MLLAAVPFAMLFVVVSAQKAGKRGLRVCCYAVDCKQRCKAEECQERALAIPVRRENSESESNESTKSTIL